MNFFISGGEIIYEALCIISKIISRITVSRIYHKNKQ